MFLSVFNRCTPQSALLAEAIRTNKEFDLFFEQRDITHKYIYFKGLKDKDSM